MKAVHDHPGCVLTNSLAVGTMSLEDIQLPHTKNSHSTWITGQPGCCIAVGVTGRQPGGGFGLRS